MDEIYQRADAFLFGRRTYELFAGYWGAEERARAAAEDPGHHPITDALNTKPKNVASTTLTEPRWANTTVLSGDVGRWLPPAVCNLHHVTQVPQSMRVDIPKTRSVKLNPDP